MQTVLHLSGADQGGAERQLLALMKEAVLRPDGKYRHVVALVRDGDLADQFEETVPTVRMTKRRKVDPRFIMAFRRVLSDVRPAVVHTWGPTPNMWGSTIAATLGPRRRPRTVLAEVGLDEWKGTILRAADKLAYATADRVVGCAQTVTDTAVERGAPRRKARTVGLGVALPERPARRPEEGLVLLLARMDWRKGHRPLLEAWPAVLEAVPHAKLIMAGPATASTEKALRDELHDCVRSDGRLRDSVELLDRVDPVPFLARSALLVVPSSSEGLPNVILEAFAHRVPVVGHDVGGIGEVLRDGTTGWLVSPHDPRGLADALVDALSRPDEAQRRGDQGRAVVETMSFSDALRGWTEIYDELLARPNGRAPTCAGT